jgi:hypothetical protein
MGWFPTLGVGFRPIGMLFLALGPGIEDVFGPGLLGFGLFLGRRAAVRRPGQEQAAGGEDAEPGAVAANRRHR